MMRKLQECNLEHTVHCVMRTHGRKFQKLPSTFLSSCCHLLRSCLLIIRSESLQDVFLLFFHPNESNDGQDAPASWRIFNRLQKQKLWVMRQLLFGCRRWLLGSSLSSK